MSDLMDRHQMEVYSIKIHRYFMQNDGKRIAPDKPLELKKVAFVDRTDTKPDRLLVEHLCDEFKRGVLDYIDKEYGDERE